MVQSKQTKTKKGQRKTATTFVQENRTVLLLAGLTVLVLLAIVAFAALITTGGEDAGNFTPNDQGLLPVGQQAPDFTAESVRDGQEISVGDGSGQATMLVFFATWCPHCNNEAPVISKLEGEYKDLRVVMVGIDGQDDPEKVREFVDRYDIESPAVYQPSLGPTYQVSGYPTTYVLDGEGKIVVAHSGEAPREAYEGWIEEALGAGS